MRCARGHRLDGARPWRICVNMNCPKREKEKADKAKKPRGGAKKKTATQEEDHGQEVEEVDGDTHPHG